MALYTRTTYAAGDVITAAKLNNAEAYLAAVAGSLARVYRNTSTFTLTGTTYTEVVWNAEDTDGLGEHSTTTGRFTAAAAGRYLVSAGAYVTGTPSGAGAPWMMAVYKNGSIHSVISCVGNDSSNGYPIADQLAGATLIDLAAADYVSIWLNIGSMGASPVVQNSQSRSFFAVSRVQ